MKLNFLIFVIAIVTTISIGYCQDVTYDNVTINEQLKLGGGLTQGFSNDHYPHIYKSILLSGQSFPFNQNGNLVLQSRSSAARNIVFMTGNSTSLPRMTISDAGFVGIGSNYPTGKLHVVGEAGEQTQGQIHIVGNGEGGPGDAYISFYEGKETNSKWSLGVKDNDNVFSISHGLTMDAAPKFVIQESTGNVGIGTATPTAGLHVLNDNGIKIDDTSNGFPGIIKMSDGFSNTTTKDDLLFESDGAFLFKLDRNGNGISNLPGFGVFDKNNEVIFFAKDNGTVGIGTTNPGSYKLNVWGKMRAHEIVVNTTGADFVFEDDYDLRPLSEVKEYINEHKHLPEIASAQEMQEEGVGVSELQTQLLQKIEELTLYLIEVKEENDELKNRIEKLEDK